jgi:hypothetical protein
MAKAKKKPVDRPDSPCAMCGSTEWCDCQWDIIVPSQFVHTVAPEHAFPPESREDGGSPKTTQRSAAQEE